jgi:hypothetical protein
LEHSKFGLMKHEDELHDSMTPYITEWVPSSCTNMMVGVCKYNKGNPHKWDSAALQDQQWQ